MPAKLSKKLIAHVLDQIGFNIQTATVEEYTEDIVKIITNTIVKYYAVYSTICNTLVNFRAYLKTLGVDESIIMQSHTPEITKRQTEINKSKLDERIKNGDNSPDDIGKLYRVISRINQFAENGTIDVDNLQFIQIDLYLMTHCRNTELEHFEVGKDGKITGGLLKKRGKEYDFKFNSFVSLETYQKYREQYNKLPEPTLKAITEQKNIYLSAHSLTVKSLREIGSSLALRFIAISGGIKCLTGVNEVLANSLRHKKQIDATAHYGLLKDDNIPLKYMLDECDDDTIAQIREIVNAALKKKEQDYNFEYNYTAESAESAEPAEIAEPAPQDECAD